MEKWLDTVGAAVQRAGTAVCAARRAGDWGVHSQCRGQRARHCCEHADDRDAQTEMASDLRQKCAGPCEPSVLYLQQQLGGLFPSCALEPSALRCITQQDIITRT